MEYIGKYRVERLLGRGGFATVWLCHDTDLDRKVAIKVLADIYALDTEIRRRFIQEARLLSRLEDARILRIHTIDELPDGRPYFVADYADRGTLRDRIQASAGKLTPIADAVNTAREVGECLGVAHHHSVVHRDLKPTNVLYKSVSRHRRTRDSEETLVLADFGIARALEGITRGNIMTTAAGTVPYMAPEQAQGRADIRCDIYAATVIFYELLAGRPPFEGETDLAVLLKKERLDFEPITSVRRSLPAEYDAFIERGLAPTPDERYATTQDWIDDLSLLPRSESSESLGFDHELPASAPSVPGQPKATPGTPTRVSEPDHGHKDVSIDGTADTGTVAEPEKEPEEPRSVEVIERPSQEGHRRARTSRASPKGLLAAIGVLIGIGALIVALGPGANGGAFELSTSSVGPHDVVLHWAVVPDGARYRILRDGETISQATGTVFEDVELTEDTTYEYQVHALTTSGSVLATSELLTVTTDEAAPSTTNTPATGSTPAPTATSEGPLLAGHVDLMSRLSFPTEESCTGVRPPQEGTTYEVTCEVDSETTAVYSAWGNRGELRERRDFHTERAGEPARSWYLGRIRLGERVAYVDSDGQAVLFWSYLTGPAEVTSGEATRPDGDSEALLSWWEDAGSLPSEPPTLSPDEERLLAEFGFSIDQCQVLRSGVPGFEVGAIAQVTCTVGQGDTDFRVQRAILWESYADLSAYWTELEGRFGVTRSSWSQDDVHMGEVLNFVGSDERPAIAWSNDNLLYLVQASTDGDRDDLEAWWQEVRR